MHNWPFENDVTGLVSREDMLRDDDDDDDDDGGERTYQGGTAANDVFIVEGRQLRYGSKAAWPAASRY